jgi:ABC-2 type transport system permease protein
VSRGAGFVTAASQSARRTGLQYLRTPALLVLPMIMSGLFMFVFRYVFGGAIDSGTSFDYVDYLVPGFLVGTVLWTAMNIPSGVAEDAAQGVYDRFRSLPIPRTAVPAGRSLADAGLIVVTLALTGALGVAFGFRTHADAGAVLAAAGLFVVIAYAFTWVFIGIGLAAGKAQVAQGLSSLVVVPLTFVSNAYVPVDSMPSWMEPFAANQPLSVMNNAVRSLLLGDADAAGLGHTTGHWVLLTLVWCTGIAAVCSLFAVARFARQR